VCSDFNGEEIEENKHSKFKSRRKEQIREKEEKKETGTVKNEVLEEN